MDITKYPDGSSYVTLNEFKPNITFRLNSYEDLWHLNQIVDAYNNLNITPDITIPYLIDAQADRRFAEDQSSGLKLVCNFLNGIDANFTIFHPHNAEVVEALMDNVKIIDNSTFVKGVLDELDIYNTVRNGQRADFSTILMSSDAGGFKPLMKLCDKLDWKGETFSASKARKYENGESKLYQFIDPLTDFGGKDVIIIDDLSIYGGTFKGLATILNSRNVGKLYLAVSHMTIQDIGADPVTNYFDKVFTTNSKYDNYFASTESGGVQPTNLSVIKLF